MFFFFLNSKLHNIEHQPVFSHWACVESLPTVVNDAFLYPDAWYDYQVKPRQSTDRCILNSSKPCHTVVISAAVAGVRLCVCVHMCDAHDRGTAGLKTDAGCCCYSRCSSRPPWQFLGLFLFSCSLDLVDLVAVGCRPSHPSWPVRFLACVCVFLFTAFSRLLTRA